MRFRSSLTLLAALLLCGASNAAGQQAPSRISSQDISSQDISSEGIAAQAIATLDWTLAETLVGLDAAPRSVAQVSAYHGWVKEPALPGGVVDLGLRSQPNMELLAALAPERILISPMFSSLIPQLSRVAPVESLELYAPGGDTWEQMRRLTLELGRLVERKEQAESLIRDTESHLDALGQTLPDDTPPLLVVQFMDARHVRVFGDNSLYQTVIERLGLRNAWTGPTNHWGFSLVGIEALIGIEARLVVVEPYPVGVEEQLAESGLWRHLPSVRDNDLITLPPAWSFGALPSARHFAERLAAALRRPS